MIFKGIFAAAGLISAVSVLSAQGGAADRRAIPQAKPITAVQLPDFAVSRLSNEMQVAVVPRRGLPLVSISLSFEGGEAVHDPPEYAGTVYLLQELLQRGPTGSNALAFADSLEALGMEFGLSFGRDAALVTAQVLSPGLEAALQLLAGSLFTPDLSEEAIATVRERLILNLEDWQASLNPQATAAFRRAAYGDAHPYGRGIRAIEPVRQVPDSVIRQVHRRLLDPRQAVLVIVGDVELDDARRIAEQAFGSWKGSGGSVAGEDPTVTPRISPGIHAVSNPGATQSQIILGTPAMSSDSPEREAAELLSDILGQGVQSRLMQNLRERRGYTYGIFSQFQLGQGPGAFVVVTAVERGVTDSAIAAILHEFEAIQGPRPVTEDELVAAKRRRVLSTITRSATLSGLNATVRTLVSQGKSRADFLESLDRTRNVSREQIEAVARRYLAPGRIVIGVAGDRDAIEPQLRGLGMGDVVWRTPDGSPLLNSSSHQ